MKKIFIFGCLFLAFAAASASAQMTAGRVITTPFVNSHIVDNDVFDKSYSLLFSRTDYMMGTSRSAAMGGAFTSLGGDLSSMSINPAGLGMYKGSDWGVTGSVSLNSMVTRSPNMASGALHSGGRNTTWGFDNFGLAWNILNKGVVTIGLSGNRVANFNSSSYVHTRGETSSIADVFVRQLTVMGNYDPNTNPNPITSDMLDRGDDPFRNEYIYLDEWGAVMGYQSQLVGGDDLNGYVSNVEWLTNDSEFHSITRGGIHEYNFSFGANIFDIVYFGATVGLSDLNYREESVYTETFSDSRHLSLNQNTLIKGSGLTAKLGLTLQPVSGFRIGVAGHLPTYWDVRSEYAGNMHFGGHSSRTLDGGALTAYQKFNSAPKLLVGVSGAIGGMFLIAADYECAWYNKIKSRTPSEVGQKESKAQFASIYKPGHTVRAGAELLFGNHFSIRVGGSRAFDIMKDKDYLSYNIPVVRSSYSVTAGFGVDLGALYFDLGYAFNRAQYTSYDFYYHDNGLGNPIIAQYDTVNGQDVARRYTPRADRHAISLTVGGRF